MFAPPRGFSQLATPFIVFWCLGIHHIPFIACLYYSILPPASALPGPGRQPFSFCISLSSFLHLMQSSCTVSCYQGVIASFLITLVKCVFVPARGPSGPAPTPDFAAPRTATPSRGITRTCEALRFLFPKILNP